MEIVIKDNKRNWQIVKDNRRFLFPPKIRLAFKICILVYVALLLINVLMHQFKLWMVFVLPMAIIILEVQIYYFAKKTINLQKEIFKKDQNKRYWYRTITIFLCNHFFLKCRNSFLNSRLQLKKSKKRRTA